MKGATIILLVTLCIGLGNTTMKCPSTGADDVECNADQIEWIEPLLSADDKTKLVKDEYVCIDITVDDSIIPPSPAPSTTSSTPEATTTTTAKSTTTTAKSTTTTAKSTTTSAKSTTTTAKSTTTNENDSPDAPVPTAPDTHPAPNAGRFRRNLSLKQKLPVQIEFKGCAPKLKDDASICEALKTQNKDLVKDCKDGAHAVSASIMIVSVLLTFLYLMN